MEEVRTRGPGNRTRSSVATKDAHRPLKSFTKPPSRDEQEHGPRTSCAPPLTPKIPSTKDLGAEDGRLGHSQRDSLKSIRDDPFFRNYQSPQSVSLARELRYASYSERLRNDIAASDPHAVSRYVEDESSVNLPPQSRSGVADINIAVIGSKGVGKSSLIQRAFGLRTLPVSVVSSIRMPVENIEYTVSLIELDLESFDIIPEEHIQWPKQINGHIVPRIDGALLLYDVMNEESTVEVDNTMTALVKSYLPTILVSCKCDNPESARHVDVDRMESAAMPSVECVKTAANVPESARISLSTILRAIMEHRNAVKTDPTNSKARARATSSSTIDITQDPAPAAAAATARPLSQASKHSRASSEYTGTFFRGPPSHVSNRSQVPSSGRPNPHHRIAIATAHDASPLSSQAVFQHEGGGEAATISRSLVGQSAPSGRMSPEQAVEKSFLDMEESDAESVYRYSDDIPILQRNDDSFFDKHAKVAGVTFDELVDRLLAQPMSRADYNFSDVFLCLYRKFAAPGELFGAILARLDQMAEDSNTQYLTRITNQLRIITVVAKWVSRYPGDFASPPTYQNLDAFIKHLASDPVFATAARDMRAQLQSRIVEDDDTDWARTDADMDNELSRSTEPGPLIPSELRRHPTSDLEAKLAKLKVSSSEPDLKRKGSTAESNISQRPSSPADSFSSSYHAVEDFEREAATLNPRATLPLTKAQYHMIMDTPNDDLANEMTRIDWVMFSSIRLRDFVRHVSLSLEQKEKCQSLANVNRMINHFNHVAKWVANLILIRDKAKHRALMLEKFMTIALKLRLLNNYNGLAAVLAGINGSAIHRLASTRALVPAEVQKRFARLVLLMGTQKSHFAYRLAWENSPLPRIPFVPLLRRDLVSAEEGSRTFVGANGARINWKKFEVLSEVILPIMRTQVVPYQRLGTADANRSVREYILACDMCTDDEDIYQRSVHVESSAGAADTGKKKFPWFARDK